MIIRRIWPLANDHPEDPATCKWSSGGSDNLQMIIWRIRPLANDHPEDPASCKWSSGGSGLLQMIIQQIQPLANDHMEVQATCKWSSGGSDHLQMIIQRIRPLANDHPEHLASGMWSSGGTGLLQMIIGLPRHPNYLSQDPESNSRTFLEQFALVKIQNYSSRIWKQSSSFRNKIAVRKLSKPLHLAPKLTKKGNSAN